MSPGGDAAPDQGTLSDPAVKMLIINWDPSNLPSHKVSLTAIQSKMVNLRAGTNRAEGTSKLYKEMA